MIHLVRLFGPQAVDAGTRRLEVDLGESATCRELKQRIGELRPAIKASLPSSRIAVNHKFVPDDHPIDPADELALIGMVSGG